MRYSSAVARENRISGWQKVFFIFLYAISFYLVPIFPGSGNSEELKNSNSVFSSQDYSSNDYLIATFNSRFGRWDF